MSITFSAKSRFCRFFAAVCALALTAPHSRAADKHAWVNLDSDIHGLAPFFDDNLANPWGLVPAEDAATVWVANNSTGLLTRYTEAGALFVPAEGTSPEVVAIPPATGNEIGSPTGLVIDHAAFGTGAAGEFVINGNPSQLLTCTQDGLIVGINVGATAAAAGIGYTNPAAGASYTGLALTLIDGSAGQPPKRQLYAANFGTGTIDVFDNTFAPVTLAAGAFSDTQAGFMPYNIERYAVRNAATKTISRVLIVSYVNPANGAGYISVYRPDGSLVERLVPYFASIANGLDSPWGMAIRRGASQAANVLLVSNFGDGTIHRFSLAGVFKTPASGPVSDGGVLLREDGRPLIFDNLWSIRYGRVHQSLAAFAADDDDLAANDGTLFFSAGISDQVDGLTGRIKKQ
jgi:uncharacterized protein (TIGR03118 family)